MPTNEKAPSGGTHGGLEKHTNQVKNRADFTSRQDVLESAIASPLALQSYHELRALEVLPDQAMLLERYLPPVGSDRPGLPGGGAGMSPNKVQTLIPIDDGLTLLEWLETQLPEPMRSRLEEAKESLVSFHFFNRKIKPAEAPSEVREVHDMAEEWACETLEALGSHRLTSPEFWDCYQVARQAGRSALDALMEAQG